VSYRDPSGKPDASFACTVEVRFLDGKVDEAARRRVHRGCDLLGPDL